MLHATPRPTCFPGSGSERSPSSASARSRHSRVPGSGVDFLAGDSPIPRLMKFRVRMSTGSMPSASAIRSTCDSYANTTCMAPKPRIALVGTVWVNAAVPCTRALATRYGPGALTRGREEDPGAQERIGPRVADDSNVLGDDRAVRHRPGPVAHHKRVAFLAGQQRLLGARTAHADRTPSLPH